jgi:hypothetical protein
MGSNLPTDFFSWKSFQSLTQTAALAWMLTLVIDVIFIQRINDPQAQVVRLWIVGGILCLTLAIVRLYFKEEIEKGDKLMVIFNAALIFLYASGFNGFTKELGSWSEVNKDKSATTLSVSMMKEFRAELASWVPNIFANQTAFWPDVKMMNENKSLKIENERLKESESNNVPQNDLTDMTKKIRDLENENNRLRSQMKSLNNSACCDSVQILTGNINLAQSRFQTLLERVDESNKRISMYEQLMKSLEAVKARQDNYYQVLRMDFGKKGGVEYVDVVTKILNTPIDTNLPK